MFQIQVQYIPVKAELREKSLRYTNWIVFFSNMWKSNKQDAGVRHDVSNRSYGTEVV